jgi:hypothetical protein
MEKFSTSRTYNKLPDPQLLKLDPIYWQLNWFLFPKHPMVFLIIQIPYFSRLPKQGSNKNAM